ncbi:BnaCnng71860D, partial [Brassica napus]
KRLNPSIAQGHLEDLSIANKSLPRRDSMERHGFVRTLLIDNYNSYTFNIYQALSTINGDTFLSFSLSLPNDEWTWEEAYCYLYEDAAFDNMVISPGHGSPIPTCVCLILNMALALRLPWTSDTGLYLWRLCGACPITSQWTVKVLRF